MITNGRRWRAIDLIQYLLPALVAVSFLLMFDGGEAKVTGYCSDCHTMHNSQGGQPVYREGTGVGWGTGSLGGGAVWDSPGGNLLVTNCLGCHTATTNQTIVTISGGNRIPIVYNTAPPTNSLAGGNFYWVAQGDHDRGHNVLGIVGADGTLNGAPGMTTGTGTCANTCHGTLAVGTGGKNGCEGCHVFTYHHADNGIYRFLKGHGLPLSGPIEEGRKNISIYPDYVQGVEAADWEQSVSQTSHNVYKGTTASYMSDATSSALSSSKSITAFCSGCHGRFHGPEQTGGGMGSSSPWIRHPTDVLLPLNGEFGTYNPTVAYNANAPVAFADPSNPSRATAVVMCLSCHRAHGSPYAKIMRWNYRSTDLTEALSGCSVCHTSKN